MQTMVAFQQAEATDHTVGIEPNCILLMGARCAYQIFGPPIEQQTFYFKSNEKTNSFTWSEAYGVWCFVRRR